ncbi:MAG: TrmH family RNA methyltransferase [Actinobacteria bacterium]|nr:TrmH family RNA methyltransferase [Actinomycetota bacterium]
MVTFTQKVDPNSPYCQWTRNVIDEFKELPNEEIKRRIEERSNGFAVLMCHITGDFNIGTVLRSANFHGAKDFFYHGKKKYDRRGCVGVHNYTPMKFLDELEDIKAIKEDYTLVALENNIEGTSRLYDFDWGLPKPPCIVVGEECNGIPREILDLCDRFVEIPNFGSVRSMNVGAAASIAMHDYVSSKHRRKS